MGSLSNLTTTEGPHWNTPEHHGPAVSVVTWVCIVGVVLAVASRIITRYAVIRTLQWDDITCLLATACAIAQSIAVSVASDAGLGSPAASLTSVERTRFLKSHYASNPLYIMVLGLVKISICCQIYNLSPVRLHRLASLGTGGFCALWAASALLVAVFACKLPPAWDILSGRCIQLWAFWTYFDILNILTDVALLALPVPIILQLRLSMGRKAVLFGFFATRIFVIAATIVHVYYLQSRTSGSTDPIYDLWIPVLCAQVIVCFSLISACVPYLKFLIDALETGMVRADSRPVGGTTRSYGSSSGGGYYKGKGSTFKQKQSSLGVKSPMGTDGNNNTTTTNNNNNSLRMNNLHGNRHSAQSGNQLQNVATKASKTDDDVDSQSSQTHIIKKIEWTLTDNHAGVEHSRGPSQE